MSKRATRQSNDWARCSEGFSDFLNSTSNSNVKKTKEKKIQPVKDLFSHGNIFEKLTFQTEESSQSITWSSSDDEQKDSSPSVGIFQKFEQKVQAVTKNKSVPSAGRKRKKANSPRAGNVRKRLNKTLDEDHVEEVAIKSDSDTDVVTDSISKSQPTSEPAIKSYDSGTDEDIPQKEEPSQASVSATSPSISDTVSSTSPVTQTGTGRKASEWLKTLQLKTPSKSDNKPEMPETEDSAKKKKKHSKGSLADRASRLQARDKSSVRMWSHQQNKLTASQDSKAVVMEVLGFESLYSMQVVRCQTAAVESAGFEPQTSSQQEDRVRLVMFPATQAAQLSLQIGTTFKVFPPWQQLELRNGRQILLCTKYCQVISQPGELGEVTAAGMSGEATNPGALSGSLQQSTRKTVSAVWNCPCIQGLCRRQTLCPAFQFPTVPGWIQVPDTTSTTGSKDGNSNVLKDQAAKCESDKTLHHLHTVSSKAASRSLTGFTEAQVFDSLLESIKKGRSLEAESGDGYAKVPCFKGHIHRAVRYRENTGIYFCRLVVEDAVGNVCEVMITLDELSLLNLNPDHMEGKAFQISGLKVHDRLTREQNPCLFSLLDSVWSGRSVKPTSQDSDFTQDSPMDRTSMPAGYCYLLSPDDQQLDGLMFEPLPDPLVPGVDPVYTSLAEMQQPGQQPSRHTCIVKVLYAHKKLTHPRDCVLYVTDPSLEKPHSYAKFVIQSACDFTHDAFAQGSPIKPVYLLRDLCVDKNIVNGDGYTRITTKKSSIQFSHLEDLEFLHMELPALDQTSEEEDLCSVSGCISEVDEDSAYSWESCVRCDSDKLEPVSENSTKCLTCKHCMEEPKTRMKMEILLRCEPVQGLVKIDLLQTTIETLLQQEEADEEGYELSSVLNKEVRSLTCMVNRIDPDSESVAVYLKEIEIML